MAIAEAKVGYDVSVRLTSKLQPSGNAPVNSLSEPSASANLVLSETLDFGVSIGQINRPCVGQYLIAAGASLTLNLYDGGTTSSDLTTQYGEAANLRLARFIYIAIVDGGDTAGVTVGNAASNAFVGGFDSATSTKTIYPDGPPHMDGSPAGFTVSSTQKNLKILNNGAVEVVVNVVVTGSNITIGMATGLGIPPTYS
jgi:hypothetical protein